MAACAGSRWSARAGGRGNVALGRRQKRVWMEAWAWTWARQHSARGQAAGAIRVRAVRLYRASDQRDALSRALSRLKPHAPKAAAPRTKQASAVGGPLEPHQDVICPLPRAFPACNLQ